MISVSKLDAGKRQLEAAIRLFMGGADPVAVHTLAHASHEVMHDLGKRKGIESFLKNKMLSMVKPERRSEVLGLLLKAGNFFKHADRDPDGLLEFAPETTGLFLWDAVNIYQELSGELTPIMLVMRAWFFAKNPDFLQESKVKEESLAIAAEKDPNNRMLYLELEPAFSNLMYGTRRT